jgi:beta-lactamase superfamily II metal-dependent hydrolase
MGYDIDYLPAGEGEKSADAICLRYGNLFGRREEQIVVTIDGGTVASGEAVAAHIQKCYGTDTVNMALLSHPDNDHASGMRRILELLKVNQVVMHRPWRHSLAVATLLDDDRVTGSSIRETTKKNLTAAREIEEMALARKIEIVEPFAGCTNNRGLTILGPTQEFYQAALANFDFMPGGEVPLPPLSRDRIPTLTEMLHALGHKVAEWIEETWFKETLSEPRDDDSSYENNSSVIFKLETDGKTLLFTGDAGVPALQSMINYCAFSRISVDGVTFFDVPHHGSRRNLGPSILNRLFGQPRLQQTKDWTAFVSAAKDATKHPSKKVTNALLRRGASVHVTAGNHIYHQYLAPKRQGGVDAATVPFYPSVENDD